MANIRINSPSEFPRVLLGQPFRESSYVTIDLETMEIERYTEPRQSPVYQGMS